MMGREVKVDIYFYIMTCHPFSSSYLFSKKKLAEKRFFSLGGLLTAVFMSNELGIRSNNWI